MPIDVKRSGAWSADLGYANVLRKQSGAWVVLEETLRKVGGSTWQQIWRKDGPPPDPTGVSTVAVNGGTNTTSWTWPANAEGDYAAAAVEVSVNGGAYSGVTETAYPGTSQARTGAVHGTTYQYRVRFRDAASNYSNWVVAAASVVGINAVPGTPVVTVAASDWSAGNFTVHITGITNSYSDTSNVSLYRRTAGGGAYTLVHSAAYTAAAINPVIAQIGYDVNHEWYATVTNLAGTSTSTTKTVYSRPSTGTTKTLGCAASKSYATATGWRADNNVYQGQFDSGNGLHTGMMFYGTGIVDLLHGHVPAGVRIFMVRNGASGFTGELTFVCHGYPTPPGGGAPSVVAPTWNSVSAFAGADATAWEPIDAGALAGLANGTYDGFGLYINNTGSAYYRNMRGPDTNAFAGTLEFTF